MSPASRLGNALLNEVIEEIGQSTRGSCRVTAEIAIHTPEYMVMIFVRMTAKDTVRTGDAGFKLAVSMASAKLIGANSSVQPVASADGSRYNAFQHTAMVRIPKLFAEVPTCFFDDVASVTNGGLAAKQ